MRQRILHQTLSQLTSHDPVLPDCPVVLSPKLAVHELAEAPGEVPGNGVLQPIIRDVQQLQRGASHHTLRHVVGHQALCKYCIPVKTLVSSDNHSITTFKRAANQTNTKANCSGMIAVGKDSDC